MGPRSAAAVKISGVSSKGQVRLPKRAREAIDLGFHAAVESTLAEWGSKQDDKAYGDL